jgi:hypothetical protein
MLLSKRDFKEGYDQLKSACNIDLVQSIDSAVLGMQARQKGVVVLALNGLDQAAVTSCIVKLAAAQDGPQKVSAKQQGNIVEYGASGEKDKVYMSWLAKDVVAFTTDPSDKALLKKLTAGGLRGDSLGKLAGALKTDAAVWVATTRSDQILGLAGAKLNKACGYADLNGGNVNVDVHAVLEDASAATSMASTLSSQLDAQRRNNPLSASLLKSVKITSSGPELVATASLPEAELAAMASLLGGI